VFFGIPLTEFAWLVVAIVAAAVATGILGGLFGGGGGAIIMPVLYEVFRTFGVSDAVRMQLCVGTSLAIILPTSIRSFLAHRAKAIIVGWRRRLCHRGPPAPSAGSAVLSRLCVPAWCRAHGTRCHIGRPLRGTVGAGAFQPLARDGLCSLSDGRGRSLPGQSILTDRLLHNNR
jgi:hypothetical protein